MIGYHWFGRIRLTGAIAIIGILLSACLTEVASESASSDGGTAGNSPPQISGSPDDTAVVGNRYVFSPSASDADGDTLLFSMTGRPSWMNFDSTSGAISGTPGAGDVGVYRDIVIDVSDGTDNASLAAFTVTVHATGSASVLLSWTPPTENEDGSVLTDLVAYKIYWGTIAGNYDWSVLIDNPSVSNYLVENLMPRTYQFTATSINSFGMESAYSNVVSKTAM